MNTPQSSFSSYKVRLPLPLQGYLFIHNVWAVFLRQNKCVHAIFTPFSLTSMSTSMEVLHRALAISLKLPTSGSCLYEKPSQKQRCRWDNTQVAPTQWSDYATLTEHRICQVSFWQCC